MATNVGSPSSSRGGDFAWWLLPGPKASSRSDVKFLSLVPRDFASVLTVFVYVETVPYFHDVITPRCKMDLPSKLWFECQLVMPRTHQDSMKGFTTRVMRFLETEGWTAKLVQKWLEKVGKGDWFRVIWWLGLGWGLLPWLDKQDLNFLHAPKVGVPELSH